MENKNKCQYDLTPDIFSILLDRSNIVKNGANMAMPMETHTIALIIKLGIKLANNKYKSIKSIANFL
jgi:hypothetical protein